MKNISTNRFKYVLFIAQTCYVKATISLVTEIKFRTKKSRQSSNAVRWPVTKNRPDLVPVYKQPRVEGKKKNQKEQTHSKFKRRYSQNAKSHVRVVLQFRNEFDERAGFMGLIAIVDLRFYILKFLLYCDSIKLKFGWLLKNKVEIHVTEYV